MVRALLRGAVQGAAQVSRRGVVRALQRGVALSAAASPAERPDVRHLRAEDAPSAEDCGERSAAAGATAGAEADTTCRR